MKTMTCRQLGGACDLEFHAETFDDLAEQSRQHGLDMLQSGDKDHLEAMKKIQQMMQQPGSLQKWMDEKRREFDNLPENENI